ncbi:UDP-3-O-(3-hydroxymyristoyl)glucosamine N-acyltransferase [Primorskyibacter aestuariivivens]|uniref:UDP-3-O-(3-hydroxymyristoyl)glucosamine N-acyltransferase n=1 Tax=Primorskyibacter aestuariivivens TaxID=1888912 RepID=UPI002301B99D|nr:UDP-3-O-(3-hydroxymyristoyl)glucosamine N-acyltransferase [Primorskyibacter aestuariivivens]MDA7426903.1 UDP-3-O-(3-hydroxymyristoyl)glucosamine N-acyltransferase [Primorskyibacter aestuariivivens]
MSYTVSEIARALGCEAVGATELVITGCSEPADAAPDQLALAMKPEYAETLGQGQAQVAMLWQGADWQALGLRAAILAERPRFAMSGLSAVMDPGPRYGTGIHPAAIVDPSAVIGKDVNIAPGAIIGAGVRIGDGSTIGPQSYIGTDVTIGPGADIREHVVICHGCTIGARFIAQPGVRVGSDGFSFVTPEQSAVERVRDTLGDQGEEERQSWARIHSLGAVTIGDDVEIGANTCIDRGTIRDTVIGNRTKIDNLVHLGHNVQIGEDCLICGQVGMAGSAKVGNNCVFAGQCGVSDNIFVGDNVIAGGATKIMSNVPKGRVLLGYPATKMENQMESYKALRRLPRLFKEVAALKKAVSKPE